MIDNVNLQIEKLFIINPNNHFFVLEQDSNALQTCKITTQSLLEHNCSVFDSYESMLEAASQLVKIPTNDLEGNEIIFKQVGNEWGEQCPGHIWMIKDQIEEFGLEDMTTIQFLANYEV